MSIPYFEAQMKLNETCRLLIEEHGFVFRPWGGSIGSVWSLRAGEFSVECDRRSDAFIIWTLSGRYGVESTPVHENSDPKEVVLDVLRKAGILPRPKREKALGKPKRSKSFANVLAEWEEDIGTSVQISGHGLWPDFQYDPDEPHRCEMVVYAMFTRVPHVASVFLCKPGMSGEELAKELRSAPKTRFPHNLNIRWFVDFRLTDVVQAATNDKKRVIHLYGVLEGYSLTQ